MTHGSLFSGIGGFDLAAEWMGWENKFHCEWNEFGQKVLKYYWPNAESFTDITKTNFCKYENKIDILTGGFPCQPYSLAGKRKGKEDERHLWPEMCRAIREIKPRWIVGENVFGLINWSEGLVFHEVQTDLEAEGYEVFSYVLPACGVNAPHKRDRVWFVAYSRNNKHCRNSRKISDQAKQKDNKRFEQSTTSEQQVQLSLKSNTLFGNTTDTDNSRFKTFSSSQSFLAEKNRPKTFSGNSVESIYSRLCWKTFPTVSPICDGDDGLSDRLDYITFSKWRKESLKAGGNAIVPQVAYQIFLTIQEYENLKPGTGETEQHNYGK